MKLIEDGLNDNKSIYAISKLLNRSYSSIYREIDRNKVYYKPDNHKYINFTDPKDIYKYEYCTRLDKSHHVCNGCKSRNGCRKEREIRIGRTYEDFCKYIIENSDLNMKCILLKVYKKKLIAFLLFYGESPNLC